MLFPYKLTQKRFHYTTAFSPIRVTKFRIEQTMFPKNACCMCIFKDDQFRRELNIIEISVYIKKISHMTNVPMINKKAISDAESYNKY